MSWDSPRVRRRGLILPIVLLLCFLVPSASHAAPGDLYVSDFVNDTVMRFDETTGAFDVLIASGTDIDGAAGIGFLDNNDLIVGVGNGTDLRRYESTTSLSLGIFSATSVPLPRGVTRGPNGNFYVSSRSSNAIIEVDPCSGEILGNFATTGLDAPIDLEFDGAGHLFVASVENDTAVEFDATGTFVRSYSTNLSQPVGIEIRGNGNLLVSDAATGNVEEFDVTTGLYVGTFATGIVGIVDIEFGRNGNLFVASGNTGEVVELDGTTGANLGVFVTTGQTTPWGLAFEPTPVFTGAANIPGFDVENYSRVTLPTTLSFAPDGALYAGRQSEPNVLGPAIISRIPPGGGPGVDYGTTINDPDAVIFDLTGTISGTAGSVIVGGTCTPSPVTGCFSAVLPNETVVPLFGPSTSYNNPFDMVYHPDGRLLASDDNGTQVLEFTPTGPVQLYTLPDLGGYIDVRANGDILTVANDGVIRIHDASGNVVDGNFYSGLGAGFAPLAVGTGTATWGDDVYAVDEITAEILRIDALGTPTVFGDGLCGDVGDLVFGADDALYASLIDQDRVIRIAVPEPDFASMLLPGLLMLIALRWRREHRRRWRVTPAAAPAGTPARVPIAR